MGNIKNLITTDEALMGRNTEKIIQFTKERQNNEITTKSLSFLMDGEIDEALSILSRIKQEKNEENRIILEHEFYGLVQNAWHREMEGVTDE